MAILLNPASLESVLTVMGHKDRTTIFLIRHLRLFGSVELLLVASVNARSIQIKIAGAPLEG